MPTRMALTTRGRPRSGGCPRSSPGFPDAKLVQQPYSPGDVDEEGVGLHLEALQGLHEGEEIPPGLLLSVSGRPRLEFLLEAGEETEKGVVEAFDHAGGREGLLPPLIVKGNVDLP